MRLRALLLRLTENLLILGFAAMIAMVFGNVVLRYGFDSGIIVSEEVSRMIFVWLSFGGAFLVARDGGHLGLTGFVLAMGRRGRWICRLVTECLSLLCMLLLISGCLTQTLLNLENYAPVSGIPQAVTYMAGLACGLGIAALNLVTLVALFRGTLADDDLVVGAVSEEVALVDVHDKAARP